MTKSNPGNFFEDFTPGKKLIHATPQTVNSTVRTSPALPVGLSVGALLTAG